MADQQDNEIPEDLLDVREAAEVAGLSVHTLRKYVQLRKIPYYQRDKGSPLMFSRSELLDWVEPKRVEPVTSVS